MVERHKHWDWVHLVYEFRLIHVQDKIVVLVYSMAHVCLNSIDDYSHVLQNFLSHGLMMPYEKSFLYLLLLLLISLSNERKEEKNDVSYRCQWNSLAQIAMHEIRYIYSSPSNQKKKRKKMTKDNLKLSSENLLFGMFYPNENELLIPGYSFSFVRSFSTVCWVKNSV